MNKFTERMFGKNIKAIVNFIDLDQDDAVLYSSSELEGKAGTKVDFDPSTEMRELLHKGYVLSENGFNATGELPNFDKNVSEYKITFHHGKKVENIENKKLKQVVHYQGAASRTPENSTTEVVFNHFQEVDLVTGKALQDKGWKPEKQNFMLIGTPTLPGFVPDQTVVGGDVVTADDSDKEYTVKFTINNQPSSLTQTAEIRYVDLNNDNKVIEVKKLTGQPNMPIEYDPQETIAALENKGFKLVDNGFNKDGDIQFFGNSDSYEPVFIITMKYAAVAVNSTNPNAEVDPQEYQKKSTFTVKFAGLDDAPKDVVQTATWNRTVTFLPKTKELDPKGYYDTDWKADIDQYQDVKIPVVAGYHTKVGQVTALPLSQENQEVTVTYEENARIIPVDENGKEIIGAPHPQITTDKDDSSKATKDEIVPDVEDHHCDLMTVTPIDPGKNLKVTYKSNKKSDTMYITLNEQEKANQAAAKQKQTAAPASESETPAPNTQANVSESKQASEDNNGPKDQVAIINFIDVDHNGASLTSSGPLVGKPGDSINALYSTEIPLKVIKKAGYHVIFNNFDSDGVVQRFDNNDLMTQVFTIGVSKKTTTQDISDLVSKAGKADIDQLRETKYQLEKIKPDLLPKNMNDDSSQTVTRLLDIVTALLNLIFVLGSNPEQIKNKVLENSKQINNQGKNNSID